MSITRVISAEEALPGRSAPGYRVGGRHIVLGVATPGPASSQSSARPLDGPVPPGYEQIYLAMGCFWGAERHFWRLPGVWVTAVGYQGGYTPHPLYEEVCTGLTGHTESVRVVYDPTVISTDELLAEFWTAHDPTQGPRQGNDIGTQYRSAVFTTSAQQMDVVRASAGRYQGALTAAGRGAITTEIASAQGHPFYLAEDYHQQYLSEGKNPFGYCGLKGTGVACPGSDRDAAESETSDAS